MLNDAIELKVEGGLEINFPAMYKATQSFPRPKLNNINARLSEQWQNIDTGSLSGKRIAITVGSRGIAGLIPILQATIQFLKSKQAKPFIVPAMGSHGGATVSGQLRVLETYGITEKSLQVPIEATMEVVKISEMTDGTPLYLDRIASEADGIVLCNKIKPHADFKGDYESGLLKMLCIGLGKHKGASVLHQHGFDNFHTVLPEAGAELLKKINIVFAVGIVENAFDDLMDVEVIPAENIMLREKALLALAKEHIPQLLFPEIDLLIIQEIGKNISGEGMDPNVTGRPGSGLAGFDAPPIKKIVALTVTPQSHGNGVGIGMTDVTTRRLVSGLNFSAIYTNAMTATILDPAKIPLMANNDKEALAIALKTAPRTHPDTAKIVWIKNTLELAEVMVSEALIPIINQTPRLEAFAESHTFSFCEDGYFIGWQGAQNY